MTMLFLTFLLFLKTSVVVGQFTLPPTTCPDGWKMLNEDTCVKFFNTPRHYQEAVDNCKSFTGGLLVSIHNAIDNRVLVNLASAEGYTHPAWIGLYCYDSYYAGCAWDDFSGNTDNYYSWASGNPSTDIGTKVYMTTSGSNVGKWYSGDGNLLSLAYFCEVPTSNQKQFCPNGIDGFCYAVHMIPLNETEARKVCQQDCGGDLVSVHSEDENFYINDIYPYDTTRRQFRIGARVTEDGTGRYFVDGTNFDYSKDGFFNPMDGLCTSVESLNGIVNRTYWMSNPCDMEIPYICKRPKYPTSCDPIDPTAVPNAAPIPTGNLVPTNPPDSRNMCYYPMYYTGNGTIYSPFYPGNFNDISLYPSCKYIITVAPGTLAQIQFSPETEIYKSTFSFYTQIEVPSLSKPFFTFTGSPPSYPINSTTNVFRMEFTSNCDRKTKCNGEKWIVNFGSDLMQM